jgi:hypothetical protein
MQLVGQLLMQFNNPGHSSVELLLPCFPDEDVFVPHAGIQYFLENRVMSSF